VRTETRIIDGRYRLGSEIGRGGAADVHVAQDLRLGREVAIKRYRSARHGIGLRRFMAEAELLAGLSHPGLLTVFDVCHDGERPFLVLQYAPGGSLRDRLDTGPLWPDRVAALGAELAEVLAYVHGKGIVHRDIKPSNVLFNVDGDCYLADFGIARALGAAHLTDSNEFIGTAAYLAPEQVLDRDPGPKADIYALGLVLLECLSGEPEYTGTDVEMAVARLNRPPKITGEFGPEWKAVLTAMTAADPDDRPTAAECAEWLRGIEAGKTQALPLPVTPSRTPRVLAGAAVLAALVAAGLAFTSGPTPTTGRPVSDPAQVVTEQPVAQQAEQQQPTTETVVPNANAVAPAAEHSPHATNPPAAPPAQQPKPDNSGKGNSGSENKGKAKGHKGP
jgi:serine/threonine protein kinase